MKGKRKKKKWYKNPTPVCLLNIVVSGIWEITIVKILEEEKNQDWIPKQKHWE